jgi:hypothetical protein
MRAQFREAHQRRRAASAITSWSSTIFHGKSADCTEKTKKGFGEKQKACP